MNDKIILIEVIADKLEQSLIEQDFYLELYYCNDLSPFEKEMFFDFKRSQQEALNYTKKIQSVVESLKKNN
ncbi:hypothetical protein [Methanobacterium sp. BAmetb5]|uniref:hypothetical protein n=1 Tax=Methanobacterium sp. BAmetb5 TaxID=2025351 RepID=UPI000E99DD07|nr:hypothetical protein [Methanobacterium sp. BAmetb5]AXV40396.1 MAG: hypothetical protein CIT02_08720 [Methanobacterium sp. BAmetb5]